MHGNHASPLSRPPRRILALLANAGLVAISLLIVAVPAEFVFRHRYGHMLYNPRPEVRAVQQYLTLDPVIGFTWQPDISTERSIRFDINDMTTPPLSTDSFGVINSPGAIAMRAERGTVDVVGLGDSFMEMAAGEFHERFKEKGLSYYSLAIHRQCPPQYTAILESRALPLKPHIVVYGIFENDFQETFDFEKWRASDLDWFSYHSGTWCGPPLGAGSLERFARTYTRGWFTFGRVLREKALGPEALPEIKRQPAIALASVPIFNAADLARNAQIRFILVLIPSKETAKGAATPESRCYDTLARLATSPKIGIDVVDLREAFRNHSDPASLYYVKDGHWNDSGIALAATAILEQLEGKANEPRSD